MLLSNHIDACAAFRKSTWETVGRYDESMPIMGFEDWDLWIKILKDGGEVYQIPEILYFYRTHNKDSVTANLATDSFLFKKSIVVNILILFL